MLTLSKQSDSRVDPSLIGRENLCTAKVCHLALRLGHKQDDTPIGLQLSAGSSFSLSPGLTAGYGLSRQTLAHSLPARPHSNQVVSAFSLLLTKTKPYAGASARYSFTLRCAALSSVMQDLRPCKGQVGTGVLALTNQDLTLSPSQGWDSHPKLSMWRSPHLCFTFLALSSVLEGISSCCYQHLSSVATRSTHFKLGRGLWRFFTTPAFCYQ